ncbi:MAG: hypothetical protein IPJ82_24950 [Lewinellaceae bacterium]|nr:hypothetical protein [Lewinellaceae bacterium]
MKQVITKRSGSREKLKEQRSVKILKLKTSCCRNNLTHAFRALRRDRIYTALNLVGLAIGLGAALLCCYGVQDELTFDRSHRQGKASPVCFTTSTGISAANASGPM